MKRNPAAWTCLIALVVYVIVLTVVFGVGIRAVINNWPVVAEYKVNQ
jgi:hypothetical protein